MNRFEDQTLSHTKKERKILHDPTVSTFSNKFLDQIYRINSKNSILRLLFNKILVQTIYFILDRLEKQKTFSFGY